MRPLGVITELRIRECGRKECARVLVDRSRSGNRRWCGPEECGNRVKAAYHRSHKKSRTSSVG
ncbi:CGNR zinc finger domain-containing protein [Microbispora rosea]|uniref:CGNR zinc finger domain-containing protein n=1 Tax=Microbispora rosea TaxID=58117 RepID=UPI00341376DE